MTDDGALRAMIYETRQDVRWIKDTLKEIKEANQAQDDRIAEIKARQDKQIGRDGAIAAAISAVVAFFTALASGGWFR
ncbi:MAG TPA: hypothetical protein PKJ93_06180 [Methanoculleus sp.]|uniref:hypothetical protein n=1 Tax=Methanoculleus sp. TaxID=90427 RepID=UPI002C81385A|nr:hypothetical protein [Methanoculleus sp.]HNQ33349.1 hypothetical protein [Methanoculleus sp.]HNT08403.1 hypothetical protein [Methanoculleus sp.]HOD08843.1 hypothetical protein [Myxococcota bacterium]